MLTSRIALALGLCLTTASASAATFDGDYQLQHQTVQGSVDICLSYLDVGGCAPLSLKLVLEDGEVGMESLTGLMDRILEDIEEARGKEVSPRVEAGLYNALERAYVQVEDQLGAALDALPQEMSVLQAPMDEARLMVELESGHGAAWALPGTVDLQSGAFDLAGSISGQFEDLSTSKGKGRMGMDVDLRAEEAGVVVSMEGGGTVSFQLL